MVYKKKMIWMLSIISVIILCAGTFLCLTFSSPYEIQNNTERHIPIKKIATSVIFDKDVIFSDTELESLVAQILPLEWTKFSLRSDLNKEKFFLYINTEYKKKNLFVSVNILPEVSKDSIILKLSDAHIGRLPVPVSFILKQMKNITIDNNSIIIPNKWCFTIRGISTQVHIEKIQKAAEGNTNIKFQASISR